MESRLSRRMRYSEELREDLGPTYTRSDVTPEAVEALRAESDRLRSDPDADPILLRIFETVTDNFQAGKPIIIVTVIQAYPFSLILIMGTPDGTGIPEKKFKVSTYQAVDLIGFLYPPIEGNPEENGMREEYKNALRERMEEGSSLALFPARKLN